MLKMYGLMCKTYDLDFAQSKDGPCLDDKNPAF